MTDRRADDGTLHMADCPYTAGAGWCSECGRGDGERDCCCDALRACTVRVLGEVREAVDALPADLRASNNDGVGGMVVHADGTASQFSKPETFREYVERERALATIDRLAQEAP